MAGPNVGDRGVISRLRADWKYLLRALSDEYNGTRPSSEGASDSPLWVRARCVVDRMLVTSGHTVGCPFFRLFGTEVRQGCTAGSSSRSTGAQCRLSVEPRWLRRARSASRRPSAPRSAPTSPQRPGRLCRRNSRRDWRLLTWTATVRRPSRWQGGGRGGE